MIVKKASKVVHLILFLGWLIEILNNKENKPLYLVLLEERLVSVKKWIPLEPCF